jgi:hypothetical protein
VAAYRALVITLCLSGGKAAVSVIGHDAGMRLEGQLTESASRFIG